MIEYSKQIAEKWNIPVHIAELVCGAYVKGDSPFYLSEYNLDISLELSINIIWEIYDFLQEMSDLSSKKKRVLNAYKKAEMLSSDLEKRINLTSSSFELDDLLIPVRPNPRSRGQIAAAKGIKPLAELILAQTEETRTVEELAETYVGKERSLTSVAEVLQGVKDILAEMIAYDETVRAMAREFAFEGGYFEITPKNKKDSAFSGYIGKTVPVHELSNDELLRLFAAEDEKDVRLKLGVQLFRITELLRHHFISNPDASGFDLICETIDDSWLRLLQPIIERDVKIRLRADAETWAVRLAIVDLEKAYCTEIARGPLLMVNLDSARQVLFLAVSGTGSLLGTTTERKPQDGKPSVSERLRQFLGRYRAEKICILENEESDFINELLAQAFSGWDIAPEITTIKPAGSSTSPVKCEWILREFDTLLDSTMKKLYEEALLHLKPISLLPKVGLKFYKVHPFQHSIGKDRFLEIIVRIQTMQQLIAGVSIKEILDSAIRKIPAVSPQQIQSIRAADNEGSIGSKNDLLKVAGITEIAFRNISGFIVIPGADGVLDRTVVHPDYYEWFSEMAGQLNVSVDTLVSEPEYMRSYVTDDVRKKIFIEKKLIGHAAASRRYILQPANKVRRKLKLSEITEGAIVSGRVTNITQFGVFVNIHAVCDGLIHISQLADEYVETPEQVVSVNDRVDVRILKVDVKKRRISLSMRNLGTMAPKVRPSRGQLDNLAEYFKNR